MHTHFYDPDLVHTIRPSHSSLGQRTSLAPQHELKSINWTSKCQIESCNLDGGVEYSLICPLLHTWHIFCCSISLRLEVCYSVLAISANKFGRNLLADQVQGIHTCYRIFQRVCLIQYKDALQSSRWRHTAAPIAVLVLSIWFAIYRITVRLQASPQINWSLTKSMQTKM